MVNAHRCVNTFLDSRGTNENNKNAMKSLTPIRQLFSSSLALSFSSSFRWLYVGLGTVLFIYRALTTFLSTLSGQPTISNAGPIFVLVLAVIVILGFVGGFWYLAFLYQTNVHTLTSQPWSLPALFRTSWRSIGRLMIVTMSTGVVVLVGILLLIIPGLIFMAWFAFAPIIAAVEGQGINAVKQSMLLVKGYFWQIAGRLIVLMLLGNIPSIILTRLHPLLGSLWSITTPYVSLLMTAVYLDLKRVKEVRY